MKIKIVKVNDNLNKGRIIFDEVDARPLIGKTFEGFHNEQFNRYELNINGEMISFHPDEVEVVGEETVDRTTKANGSKIVVGSQTF